MGEEELIMYGALRPYTEQPFLIPPAMWEIGTRCGYIHQVGERFFVGRHWVMKAEYMETQ